MNKVILAGRLTKDPELKYTPNGAAVANFTVAVNRRFKNTEGNYEADFINCQAWNKTAEFVAQYFKKGQEIALEGRMQVRSYEKDGERRWATEVVAEQVEFIGSKAKSEVESLGEEIVFTDNELPF